MKRLRLYSMAVAVMLCGSFLIPGIAVFADPPEDNAAPHYIQAVELLRYPQAKTVSDKLGTVITQGWQGQDKDLIELMQQNQPALDKFKQGIRYQKCDFFGQTETPGKREIYFWLINLSKIVHLQARYFESQKNPRDALEAYLSVLVLASHAAQEKSVVASTMAVSLEQNTLSLLKEYLDRRATKQDCVKIAVFLDTYGKNRFVLKPGIDAEKKFFLMAAEDVLKIIRLPDALEKQALAKENFRRFFRQSAQQAADKYYSLLAEAAEKNDDRLWERIEEDIRRAASLDADKLLGELKQASEKKQDISPLLVSRIVDNILIGGVYLPRGVRSLTNKYFKVQQEFHTLQQTAKQKAGQ